MVLSPNMPIATSPKQLTSQARSPTPVKAESNETDTAQSRTLSSFNAHQAGSDS